MKNENIYNERYDNLYGNELKKILIDGPRYGNSILFSTEIVEQTQNDINHNANEIPSEKMCSSR